MLWHTSGRHHVPVGAGSPPFFIRVSPFRWAAGRGTFSLGVWCPSCRKLLNCMCRVSQERLALEVKEKSPNTRPPRRTRPDLRQVIFAGTLLVWFSCQPHLESLVWLRIWYTRDWHDFHGCAQCSASSQTSTDDHELRWSVHERCGGQSACGSISLQTSSVLAVKLRVSTTENYGCSVAS